MAAHEPGPARDAALLEEGFLALDTPEGFRAELIEGNVVVTPPPDGEHEDMISSVIRQVIRNATTEMDVSGTKGLLLPAGGDRPRGRVVPDATFAPRERRLFRGASAWMLPDGVTMVAEVTGSDPNPDRDRVAERASYATAAVPLYLLIDREQEAVTLYSDPDTAKGDYTGRNTVDFGKTLPLPEPFGFDLETAELA